jgi:hypothetical protein
VLILFSEGKIFLWILVVDPEKNPEKLTAIFRCYKLDK